VKYRVLRLAKVPENAASFPVCLLKPTKTEKYWRRRSPRVAEIGRRQVTNTVRFTVFKSVVRAVSHVWKGF
jgi:hypothetical protein